MTTTEAPERWREVGAYRWLIRTLGQRREQGTTTVFIPGLGSGEYLCRHAQLLAAGRRVLLPDMPGFGRSQTAFPLRSVDDFAAALVELIAAEGDGPVDLVGNSFGTQVALAAAASAPEQVRRLVLIGPTFDRAARTLPRMLARWLVNMPMEPPALALSLARSYAMSGVRVPWLAFRAGMQDTPEAKVAALRQPILLIRGKRDTIAPRSWLEELRRCGRDVQIAEVPKAAHTVDFAAPEQTAALVKAFLDADAGRDR